MPYIWIAVIAIVLLIIFWFIGTYNSLIRLRNKCEEGFSTMDVYLKKRFDLIPNLVETVKGYAKHESETLEKVIAARNMVNSASTVEERVQSENMLTGTLKSLFAVAEAYPDLKANTNFMDLQGQLQGIEADIANSRKYYNAVVLQYNNKRETVPSNIVAGMFGFKKETMFEAAEAEREAVKVDFGA